MLGLDNKDKLEKGMTLLEALVATAIIGIGFVAVFQMVNYSVQSIDVSGERTKASYLVSMVAEDLISEKNSSSPTSGKKLMDYLYDKQSGGNAWEQISCKPGTSSTVDKTNTWENKEQKWNNRFSKKRIKCRNNEKKILKIYDICRSGCSHTVSTIGPNPAKYNKSYGSGIFDKWYLGKMEVNMPTGGSKTKKKYLYFQIN